MEKAMSGRESGKQGAFDVRKATAATALLVKGTGETMYPVMKMMYLADKLHLERFGQFIAGDSYSAMKEGPVPCLTYDLMKHLRGGKQEIAGANYIAEFLTYEAGHQLRLKREPDLDELSESEIECLEEVVSLYKKFGKWGVYDMSHDEAWRETWSRRYFAKSKPMSMESIASGLENRDALLEHIKDPQPGAA
jgi:uncharacterized phage-associated protein